MFSNFISQDEDLEALIWLICEWSFVSLVEGVSPGGSLLIVFYQYLRHSLLPEK